MEDKLLAQKKFKKSLLKNKYFTNTLRIRNYILSFAIPFIGMILIFAAKGVFPFGERSFIRTDLYNQYAPFFSELQYKLTHFESLFHTWDLGLGTNFLTIIAYYLSSGLNLLIAIWPKEYVIEFITLLTAFKMGCASLAMCHYLTWKFKKDTNGICFFAIFYSLSGYYASYSWNTMWLSVIMLFPILMLAFDRMFYQGKGIFYSIVLGATILSNYYISVMICMFLFVYFIATILIVNENRPKIILKRFLNFGIYSLLGGMLSCMLLVPVICAFRTTASNSNYFPKVWSEYFSIIDVISRHMIFTKVEMGLDHWPNIYCGIAVIPFVILYFMSKKIRTKEKVIYALLILLFYATFALNIFNFIVHAFHYPNSLPARHGFIYVFIILFLGYRAYSKFSSFSEKEVGAAFAISISLVLLANAFSKNGKIEFFAFYFSLILLLIYLLLADRYKKRKLRGHIVLITFIVLSIEAILNMGVTSVATTSRTSYVKDNKDVALLTNDLKKEEGNNFYRIEKITRKTKDDGAWMNFYAASIFSSSAYKKGSDFYKKIGCEAAMNAYSITGSTPLINSLFSLKYGLWSNEVKKPDVLNLELVSSSGETYLYKNLATLPFCYVMDDGLIEKLEKSLEADTPPLVQNDIAQILSQKTILEKIPVVIKGREANLVVPEDGDYYAYVPKTTSEVEFVYDGKQKTFSNLDRGFFIELGLLEKGGEAILRNAAKESKSLTIDVYKFNFDVLNEIVGKIGRDIDVQFNKNKSGYLDFDVNSKKNGTLILTTIFDPSWSIYLDGKKVEQKEVFDTFNGIDITRGKHNIVMKFMPIGFYVGLLITIMAICILILIYSINKYFYIRIIQTDNKPHLKISKRQDSDK